MGNLKESNMKSNTKKLSKGPKQAPPPPPLDRRWKEGEMPRKPKNYKD